MTRSMFKAALLLMLAVGCSPQQPTLVPASVGSHASLLPSAGPIVDGTYVIAGQTLHLECQGSGGPTVVLESGLNNDASVWDRVFVTSARTHHVCRYDRPGLGQSVPRSGRATGLALVDQLRALLSQAGSEPPYLLVGASFGGLLAQLHARSHPEEVEGVVLVDSTHPQLDERIELLLSAAQRQERRDTLSLNEEGLSYNALLAIDREVEDAGPFPSLPLAVLRHGQDFDASPGWPNLKIESLWLTLQQELAALAPNSQLVVAARSQHRIAQTEPELVAAAIDWAAAPGGPIAMPSSAPVLGAEPLPSAAPRDGLIAYVVDGNLMSLTSPGLDRKVVVHDDATAVSVARVSPDGTHVAYIRAPRAGPEPGKESATELVVAIIDGKDGRTVVSAPGMNGLDWAPDGRSLAFSSHGQVMLVGASGGAPAKLADGGCPLWAPDGNHLALCSPDDEVQVVAADGSGLTSITDAPGVDEPRAWSADGSRLAIYSERDGNGEAYVLGRDGSDPVRITTSPGSQIVDAWLRDGSLVIASFPADTDALYWVLTNDRGGSPRALPILADAGEPIHWYQAHP